jgi:L-asparaginase
MPTVHILGCGGTIASEPGAGGAAPAKAGAELVERVPRVAAYADVEAMDVASHPGFDTRFPAVLEVARRARGTDADGVVVTHGTDTLADTAHALGLLVDGVARDLPVVVTGSQRRFDEPSSDAPANLATAVRAAADDRFAGAFVAFDGELHAADEVVKAHTNALSTMESPEAGPVATFTRAGSRLHREPRRESPTLGVPDAVDAEVAVVNSGLGAGAGGLERAVAADVDGVVLEGTGLGNATAALGDAVADAVDEVPVVVASRCHAGPTEAVYGTPGGAVTLREHGAWFAGALPASKARVTLALALSAGLDRPATRALFDGAAVAVDAREEGDDDGSDGDGDGDRDRDRDRDGGA